MDCPVAPPSAPRGSLTIPEEGRLAPSHPTPVRPVQAGRPGGSGAAPRSCCGDIATSWWPSAWEPRSWWPSACCDPAPTRAAGSCRLAHDQCRGASHRPGRLDQHTSDRSSPPVPVDLHGAGGGKPGGHLPGEGHGTDGLDDQRLPGPAAGRRRATGPGGHRRRRRAGPPRRTGGHHRTGLRRMDTAGAERRLSGRDDAESRRAVRVPHRTERPGEHLDNESHWKPRRAFFTNRPGITRISGVFSEHFPRNTCRAFRNSQHSSLFWSPSSDDSAGRRGWAMDRTQESNTYHTGYSCK